MTAVATNIVELKIKGAEPRVSAVNPALRAFYGRFTAAERAIYGSFTDEQKAAFEAVTPQLDPTSDDDKTIQSGVLRLIDHLQSGQEISTTSLIKQIADEESHISLRMLNDKCKPLLFGVGIFQKIPGNKTRWINSEELKSLTATCNGAVTESLTPATELQRTPKHLQRIASALHPQKALNAWTLYRARHSAWMEVNPDGSIQKHRKPFSGELTPAEKKAKREQAERTAYAKLLGSNQPVSKAAAELAERKQLEAIARKAEQQAQMDTFWMWAKILGVAALVWFAISSMGTGTATNDQILPSGVHGSMAE